MANHSLNHVHLGTGALGLGLIGWLGWRAGLSVTLANRSIGASALSVARNHCLKERLAYDVIVVGKSVETVIVKEFLSTCHDRDKFIGRVTDPNTILLTTAVKEGINDPSILKLLAEAISARCRAATSTPLYIIACENSVNTNWLSSKINPLLISELSEVAIPKNISFSSCMVDRICVEPILNQASEKTQVGVEEFAKWIIEHPSGASTLRSAFEVLRTRRHVDFVDNLQPYLRRKRWLVNGPHLLLALNAWAEGYIRLDEYIANGSVGDELLKVLLREATKSYSSIDPYFGTMELAKFNAITRRRFRKQEDLVSRILSRFSDPSRLREFISDFYGKVTDPTMNYVGREGKIPFMTAQTLFLFTKLVHEGNYPSKNRI